MPYPANPARRPQIPKTKYNVKNWREYDQAWQQRGRWTVWVTHALESSQPLDVTLNSQGWKLTDHPRISFP